MAQFHVYLDGEPTKGIFDSLEEAQKSYTEETVLEQNVEVVTVNSSGSVQTWYFDIEIKSWVAKG